MADSCWYRIAPPTTVAKYFADRQEKINDSGRGAEANWKFKWCVWVKSDIGVSHIVGGMLFHSVQSLPNLCPQDFGTNGDFGIS